MRLTNEIWTIQCASMASTTIALIIPIITFELYRLREFLWKLSRNIFFFVFLLSSNSSPFAFLSLSMLTFFLPSRSAPLDLTTNFKIVNRFHLTVNQFFFFTSSGTFLNSSHESCSSRACRTAKYSEHTNSTVENRLQISFLQVKCLIEPCQAKPWILLEMQTNNIPLVCLQHRKHRIKERNEMPNWNADADTFRQSHDIVPSTIVAALEQQQ